MSDKIPLHAPVASVPKSTAKSRIEPVTRTDSTQAAAAGIGRAKPDDDVHNAPAESSPSLHPVVSRTDDLKRVPSADPFPLRQKTSFSRSTPNLPQSTSKPASVYENEHEHGIPEIGRQIPLNPNAGDAQAPSPAPTQSQHTPGIGYFNDGSGRAHTRRKSARPELAPTESYGLHGHSQDPYDHFEKEWYAKNPKRAAQEGYNVYGRERPETALSSAELNRLVTQTSDIGMGKYSNWKRGRIVTEQM